ncbi:MAG: DUF6160 family protein [Desulfomonilia bacterium]|jgi:hypothetical protein
MKKNILLFLAILMLPVTAGAMTPISDHELSNVTGQAGVSISMDVMMNSTFGSFKFSDTDNDPVNWIEFNNITITSRWETLQGSPPITLDIATGNNIDNTERTWVNLVLSQYSQPETWDIGNFVFVNQDIGNLQLENMMMAEPAVLRFSAHPGVGTSGLEFEYLSSWMAQDISYNYNTSGGNLQLSGIHFAASASSPTDDPSNPSTWQFTGSFRVGDLMGGNIPVDSTNASVPNPATFDVGTTSDGYTSVYLNLPLKGTIRVADVQFGGQDLGPIAIDGIVAHHLFVKIGGAN